MSHTVLWIGLEMKLLMKIVFVRSTKMNSILG